MISRNLRKTAQKHPIRRFLRQFWSKLGTYRKLCLRAYQGFLSEKVAMIQQEDISKNRVLPEQKLQNWTHEKTNNSYIGYRTRKMEKSLLKYWIDLKPSPPLF